MAIRSYYDEHEYYVVDTLSDIMDLASEWGLYIKISKRYLDKDNNKFIYKGYEDE
jgi:hypothetical protein